MKVLVTGGRGQLGRALAVTTPAAVELISVGRDSIDLADPVAAELAVGRIAPDVVINAAAYTAVDRAENEPELAQRVNAESVGALARAAARGGGRLVQVSSDFVFDGASSVAYRPGDARNPLSVYGASKAAGEDSAELEALIVRTSWVHAAHGTNFVLTMLRLMRERGAVRVVAAQIGAPTWATGLAHTIWGLLDQCAKGVYHHRDAGVASWYDLAVAAAEEGLAQGLLGSLPTIEPIPGAEYPTPARRPAFSLLDDSATRIALGAPAVQWRTNLRYMLMEQKSHG